MQRPVRGYRGGGIRAGHHSTHIYHINDNNDSLSLSNSNSDEKEDNNNENDSTIKSELSSILIPKTINTEFESAIRNLCPLKAHKKKSKTNLNISKQKADLPQLNILSDETNNINEHKEDKQLRHWFPKPDIGHVDSSDFIRHNHVESQQPNPPSLLTTIPPVGVSTRPTAIVAPAGPTRSISAFFSSNSSIKKANSSSYYNLHNISTLKSDQTASSAFQPIHSLQNLSSNQIPQQTTIKLESIIMDIPTHKALERGQKLTKVHISHPQSPSIVHLMLNEDFNKACRLLHKMAAHAELQSNYVPIQPFKPELNHICACFHESRWFRCRILQISPDSSIATVVYLDWGMIIPVQITPAYIRRLPNEFYAEPTCSIMCHLDGVPDPSDSISSDIIAQCITLLSENEYDVTVNDYDGTNDGKIILSHNGRVINDRIRQLLTINKLMSAEEELMEQFQHEIPLSIGAELKALLSSFSGKDDSFYLLLINDNTVAIDRAMSQLQEDNIPDRHLLQIPQVKTLVVARYADDGKYYRAWVKSVNLSREQARVFFVDFGNESSVSFPDIYICPESVRTLPWLGIRVRLTNEIMTLEELTTFWKLAESNYIWIRINEILKDSYGIQIKIDYTAFLRHERLKMLTLPRSIHKGVQTILDEKLIYPRNSSERNSCLLTPLLTDQSQIGNENYLRNLFEMINNELRSLRHRINDSDESSQDRHGQLMQLLLSTFNLNHSNHQKRFSN